MAWQSFCLPEGPKGTTLLHQRKSKACDAVTDNFRRFVVDLRQPTPRRSFQSNCIGVPAGNLHNPDYINVSYFRHWCERLNNVKSDTLEWHSQYRHISRSSPFLLVFRNRSMTYATWFSKELDVWLQPGDVEFLRMPYAIYSHNSLVSHFLQGQREWLRDDELFSTYQLSVTIVRPRLLKHNHSLSSIPHCAWITTPRITIGAIFVRGSEPLSSILIASPRWQQH